MIGWLGGWPSPQMNIIKSSIVNFGKYKGKKYAEMLEDEDYCKWLIKGDWLKGDSRIFLERNFPCENEACVGGRVYLTDGVYGECTDCRS